MKKKTVCEWFVEKLEILVGKKKVATLASIHLFEKLEFFYFFREES